MPVSVSTILEDAVREAEDRVYAAVQTLAGRLSDDVCVRDELERTIDDVTDPAIQASLRLLLRRLDSTSDEVRTALQSLSIHGSFDPVRIVVKDIACGHL